MELVLLDFAVMVVALCLELLGLKFLDELVVLVELSVRLSL